jgi:hypothetical protein
MEEPGGSVEQIITKALTSDKVPDQVASLINSEAPPQTIEIAGSAGVIVRAGSSS